MRILYYNFTGFHNNSPVDSKLTWVILALHETKVKATCVF